MPKFEIQYIEKKVTKHVIEYVEKIVEVETKVIEEKVVEVAGRFSQWENWQCSPKIAFL